jgi:hypothetical protein
VDFVVVGFGLGALGVLLGFGLRDPGRRWCRGQAARAETAGAGERWLARGRVCGDAGATLLLAGLTVCLATLLALAADVADGPGLALIAGSGLLAGGAGVAWLVAARRQLTASGRARRSGTATAEADPDEPPPLAVAIASGARRAGVDLEDELAPVAAGGGELADTGETTPETEPSPSAPERVAPPVARNGNAPAAAIDTARAAPSAGGGDEPAAAGAESDESAEAETPPADLLSPLPNPS